MDDIINCFYCSFLYKKYIISFLYKMGFSDDQRKDADSWLVNELKELCNKLNLKTTGNHNDLCRRLSEYFKYKLKEMNIDINNKNDFLNRLNDLPYELVYYMLIKLIDQDGINEIAILRVKYRHFNNVYKKYEQKIHEKVLQRYKAIKTIEKDLYDEIISIKNILETGIIQDAYQTMYDIYIQFYNQDNIFSRL